MSSLRSKLGGLLLRPALRGLRDEIDPEEAGGAVLLGLRRLAVVPHGSFGERGFARAIEVAARGVREDVAGRTHARLQAAGALRAARRTGRPRRPLACPISHDPRRSPGADPRAPGRRAGARSGAHHGGHALPRGPGGGLARPLHARAGAGGLLRREDVRRGGRAHPHRRRRRSTSCSPTTPPRGPDRCARCTTCWSVLPEGLAAAGGHALVLDGAAGGVLRAAGLPGRLGARPGRDHAPLPAPGRRTPTAPAG